MNTVLKRAQGSATTEPTGYARALAAAERLKRRYPSHELLRLVHRGESADMDRWDQERIERFYQPTRGGSDYFTTKHEVDKRSFSALADAMERVMQPVPTASIERARVFLEPSIDVFNVTLEQAHPPGTWMHTAPSEGHLNAFFEGAKAMAGCLGLFFSPPSLPPDWRIMKAFPETKDPDPIRAEIAEPSADSDRDTPL